MDAKTIYALSVFLACVDPLVILNKDSLTDQFQYNIWGKFAEAANVSSFCLPNGLNPHELLENSLIPMCHNPVN